MMKPLKRSVNIRIMKKNNISSLYVHIPFCQAICSYCDFPKLQYFRNIAEKYLLALENEIKKVVKNKKLKTIYVGGGTPTSLDDDLFLRLLEILKPYSTVVEEYTVEANPESLSENKIKMMKRFGVNRVSIGVESTNDDILKNINRKHTFIDVINAVNLLKENGIDNFNLDLILGLPNVSETLLKKDIDNILMLKPKHISTYSLTVHPHTVFYINNIKEPDDDYARQLYDIIHQKLLEAGYIHYEVSNFALTNYQSKHNFVYWRNEPYYGVGLGAAGYIDNIRYKNTTNLNKYLNEEYVEEQEIVSIKDLEVYEIMLNLRTNQGIDLNKFINIFYKDLYIKKKEKIDELIKNNLLIIKDHHLIATYQGMMILDQITLDLLS